MDETELESNDSRLRIMETDEAFFFTFGDRKSVNQSQSVIGQGIDMFFFDEDRMVSAFQFKRPDFSFEDVQKWLEEQGFNPSDEQKVEFEEPKQKMVYLEGIEGGQLSFGEEFQNDKGDVWLRAEAIAITPGTFKDITFTNESLKDAVNEYKTFNVVEHHAFDTPGDVKGRSLGEPKFEEDVGIKTSFVVFDEDSIRKVKSGFFHSVSSNFLLTVDDANLVTKINKVVELTLTDNPAVEGAIITESEPMNISVPVPLEEATSPLTATKVVVFSKDPPPVVEESGGKMSEEVNTELEKQTSAELEAKTAELEAAKLVIEQQNERIAKQEEAQLESDANSFVNKWVSLEKKVKPAASDDLKELYLSLKGNVEAVEKVFATASVVLPEEDKGAIKEEGVVLEEDQEEVKLGEDELSALLRATKDGRLKKQGDDPFDVSFHAGVYDKQGIGNKPIEELLKEMQ